VRDHVEIHTEFARNLPRVEGDRVQLQQVLQNLISNGIDALHAETGRKKELWIETSRGPSNTVLVKVKDAGVGLSRAVSERIFEPFFTTKPQGIGLGLSISRSIIDAHGGALSAQPNPAGGAIFQFSLPAAASLKHD
jgi:C4-dicarboxylate-specific signal transduction histidine kinase